MAPLCQSQTFSVKPWSQLHFNKKQNFAYCAAGVPQRNEDGRRNKDRQSTPRQIVLETSCPGIRPILTEWKRQGNPVGVRGTIARQTLVSSTQEAGWCQQRRRYDAHENLCLVHPGGAGSREYL